MRRVGIVLVVMSGLLVSRPASADRVGLHARQLRTSSASYKLRLSAALSLSKSRDARAVRAMLFALQRDRNGTVRRVAALSLTKMVDASVRHELRQRVIKALERAAKSDRDAKVRRNAKRALSLLSSLRTAGAPRVYLRVAMPRDPSRKAPRGTPVRLHSTVKRTLRSYAPAYSQAWPTGKLPTASDLRKNNTRAYFVGSTVVSMKVQRRRGRAEVRCTVAMRVNPWGGRGSRERWTANNMASARGSGKVTGSNTRAGIDGAKRDCLVAVIEVITARQVVPFIKRLVRR